MTEAGSQRCSIDVSFPILSKAPGESETATPLHGLAHYLLRPKDNTSSEQLTVWEA